MFISALSRIGSADAIVEQIIVGEELAQGAHVSAREGSNLRPSGRKAKNPTTEPLYAMQKQLGSGAIQGLGRVF